MKNLRKYLSVLMVAALVLVLGTVTAKQAKTGGEKSKKVETVKKGPVETRKAAMKSYKIGKEMAKQNKSVSKTDVLKEMKATKKQK